MTDHNEAMRLAGILKGGSPMTTPTREQVIAAFAAEFEPMGYEMELAKCQCCTFANERTQDAFMGFSAGRDQGLREAKEVCEADLPELLKDAARNDGRQSDMAFGSVAIVKQIVADIEQLRGK